MPKSDLVDGVLHEEQPVLHRVTQVLHKRRRLLLRVHCRSEVRGQRSVKEGNCK